MKPAVKYVTVVLHPISGSFVASTLDVTVTDETAEAAVRACAAKYYAIPEHEIERVELTSEDDRTAGVFIYRAYPVAQPEPASALAWGFFLALSALLATAALLVLVKRGLA